MDDFITGLVVGRNEAAALGQEWAEYARGLQAQAGQLHQELHAERINRAINRADIAGILTALSTLPEAIQDQIQSALDRHYVPAFVHRAKQLGLQPDHALQSARTQLNATRLHPSR
ncbi:hypothetical protein [Magnetospirillum sulfuroxidans]|uniref:Uncharacterized protein n=1 Tax=Magnetospirillum sulfuroxidans TaxID=611300 RepID=A0ABS5IE49_9PROT|nr:hypothetical protein [Magnetospirillum sulfuroxidans]MBR9972703.1 hypothetical protein [Magnetospirillum sulfuroxidans]